MLLLLLLPLLRVLQLLKVHVGFASHEPVACRSGGLTGWEFNGGQTPLLKIVLLLNGRRGGLMHVGGGHCGRGRWSLQRGRGGCGDSHFGGSVGSLDDCRQSLGWRDASLVVGTTVPRLLELLESLAVRRVRTGSSGLQCFSFMMLQLLHLS